MTSQLKCSAASLRVLQPQRAAGGEALEGGGQRGDGAPGAAVVEQAAQFREAARFADHQTA